MTGSALLRLEALQRGFGQVLRAPLDRSSGTLCATPDRYDAEMCAAVMGDAGARLAIYNRQYWFRLFGVLQQAYRVATALLGAWAFNDLASRFLVAHPPVGHDLGRAVDGFASFVLDDVPAAGIALPKSGSLPKQAIVEAVRIDDAFRTVFAAPDQPALQLGAADADRLSRARLRTSAAFVMVDETWPLIALRRGLSPTVPERPIPLPSPHPGGRHAWAICRGPDGQRVIPLAAAHAELLCLLQVHPVAEALAILESGVPDTEVATIATDAQRWFAEGLRFGFWTTLEDVA